MKDAPRPRLEIVDVQGNPTDAERAGLEEALLRTVEAERRGRAASVWRRASRGQGRRLGMYDYRDRFTGDDAWRLSTRFPAGGREYPGRNGRGDTR
ncbi:MAG TPA: hypothetical protein VFS18_04945 [Actinomycetota bacterium]|nr:hypothetical protein [Actinomycetota bacterium]